MIEEAESQGSMSQDEVDRQDTELVESLPAVHTVPGEHEESVPGPFEEEAVEEGKI